MTHQSTELDRVRRLDQIEQKNTEAQSIRKTLEFIDITEYWEDTSASATTYDFLVTRANARELESAEIQYDLDPQDCPDPTNEPDKFPETTQEQALGWMIEHEIRDPARAILRATLNHQLPDDSTRIPTQVQEFQKCISMLDAVPQARAGMELLAQGPNPYWKKLARNWDNIEEAIRNECGSEKMPLNWNSETSPAAAFIKRTLLTD